MKLVLLVCLMAALIAAIASMPRKAKDMAEEPEKAEEHGTGSAGRQTAVTYPDETTVSLVRPIRRELGWYSGTRPTDD